MTTANKVTFYLHNTTMTIMDYDTRLETAKGIMWSMTGKLDDVISGTFEEGKTFEEVKARIIATAPSGDYKGPMSDLVDVLEGEPVSRSFNMNPHGLI